MKNIKVEPEDESYEHVEPERQNDESIGSTERAVKRRKSKTDDYDSSFAASSSKRSNVCNSEPESNFNQIRNSYQSISSTSQSSSSHSSVSQRDPRLKKHLNGNSSEITTSPLTAANNANRKKFLDGILSTEDVLNLPATSSSNTHPQQIRKILSRTHEAKKLLNLSSTSSFYAKISDISLIPGGSNEQRSPMISSNNNAVFRSQATTSNIRESLIGKRYNNVPQELHSICQHLGVDIDALSQKMKPLRKETSETCFNENQRTIQTQTDKLGSSEPTGQSNVESNVDNKVDKEVQTEKNNGVFSIEISDLSKLTEEQRKGLIEFKRVCFILRFFIRLFNVNFMLLLGDETF